jgi:hypothetical protein
MTAPALLTSCSARRRGSTQPEAVQLNGRNGFQITGEGRRSFSGVSVSSAGDINGDGFDDVIIGASGADPNDDSSGASYVVFGQAEGFDANLNLSSLNGRNGFQITGEGRRSLAAFPSPRRGTSTATASPT